MSGLKSNFRIEELVPPDVHADRGAAAIELLDPRSLPVLNRIRNFINEAITINDWLWGGGFTQSGLSNILREALYSQHKYGRAFDLKFKTSTAKEVALLLIKNRHLFPEISFIEIDRSWLHIDFRFNYNGLPLVLWSPSRGYVSIEQYLDEN